MRHENLKKILDQALASKDGVRLNFADATGARQFRMQIYAYRRLTAKQSREIYPLGDQMHGKSPYEDLIIAIPLTKPTCVTITTAKPLPEATPL